MSKINLENLNIVKDCYGADWSAKLRQELKNRGVRGVSVKSNRGGYTDSVTVTIKLNNSDYNSLEELTERDAGSLFLRNISCGRVWIGCESVNLDGKTAEERKAIEKRFYKLVLENAMKSGEVYNEPKKEHFPELSSEGFEKLSAVYKIVSCANDTESDPYTDYYRTNYYLTVKFYNADGINIREEMTSEERAVLKAEREEKQKEFEKQCQEYEKQREIERKAEEEHRQRAEKEISIINQAVKITDCAKPYMLYDLIGGIGKESTAEELEEVISEHPHICRGAEITREIELNSEALKYFEKYFLYDFEFLKGHGGYMWDDEKKEETKLVNCVAVYSNNKLAYIIDPEGYSYARYVYKLRA